jgi:hypothetical protein
MKLHYFFQPLKGKDDVLAEILAGNLHTDYMGECTAFLYIIYQNMSDESA